MYAAVDELLVARGCEEPGAEEADDPAPLRARNAALEAENTALRAELARMERDAPALCILVQRALLKSMSLSDSDLISDLAVM